MRFEPRTVIGVWRERAIDVRGRALDCGHFLAEKAPAAALAKFFATDD